MQYNERDGMHMKGPTHQCPMMPQHQLETMYPKTYQIIQPVVQHTCAFMEMSYGPNYTPTQEILDYMVDHVYRQVESNIEDAIKDNLNEDERQLFFGGRPILRDLIGILLIQQLLRRRPYGYGYPGFYGGTGFYGYPGY